MPLVLVFNTAIAIVRYTFDHSNAQEEENDNIRYGADHFDKILDGSVGLAGNVRKGL